MAGEDSRGAEQPSDDAADVSPLKPKEQSIRDYFRWRQLPWWICFFAGVFLFAKFQLVYNDSPCAVLGTQSPVESSDVKKAFRTVSMCTHPDRLRGRLQRPPTPAEVRRGETLFNRASHAKDMLTEALRGRSKKKNKKIACYSGELELAVVGFFGQLAVAASDLGVWDYYEMIRDFIWSMISFQAGFFNTLCAAMWFAFMYRILKQFFVYVWHMGLIKGVVAIVTTVVIGPLPTFINFFALPLVRPIVFLHSIWRPAAGAGASVAVADSGAGASGAAAADSAAPAAPVAPSTSHMPVATEDAPRNLRQRRPKPQSDADREQRERELLAGEASASDLQRPTAMPDGALACVRLVQREPIKARTAAAIAVQFDVLLVLTKPIIPLGMLLCTGQVWSGIISSVVIGHALRRWVPQMGFEAHHLMCCFFGVMHTILGVSASQVEDYANREGASMLHLTWSWSFKDIMCIMNMVMLGATCTAVSGLGNEPSYTASFASGIALRIALAQDSVSSVSVIKAAGDMLEGVLKDLGVQLVAADEVVAYSGGGIGDCGGGPFRMLLGDGDMARWAAMALKLWLLLLPLLASAQWLHRTVRAGRMLGKRWKMARFVQRLILFSLGLLQCFMILGMELNASNGALANFWVAMLFGCALESLLSTHDVRGLPRQILCLGIFLLA